MPPASLLSRRHALQVLAGGAALAVGLRPSAANEARIDGLIGEASGWPTIARRIDYISRALIGLPYRGYTLIGGPRKPEQFVVRDDGFDCVTFCETVLAAARAHEAREFEPTLKQIRYRDGAVEWRARNHYFAEWSTRNIANRTCMPVVIPGGVAIDKTLNWMPELGKRRVLFTAIPRASLLANKPLLATGDIIGFLSERPKLDYFHIGFVVVGRDGGLWLRHAAKSKHRVLDERLDRFLSLNRVRYVTLLRAQETGNATG